MKEELGHAVIAGVRMPISGVHLCSGTIGIQCIVPSGFPGCIDGIVTLFGHDGMGILQIPETVTLPPVPDNIAFAVVELQLGG